MTEFICATPLFQANSCPRDNRYCAAEVSTDVSLNDGFTQTSHPAAGFFLSYERLRSQPKSRHSENWIRPLFRTPFPRGFEPQRFIKNKKPHESGVSCFWRWVQSAANPSLLEFPVLSGKFRENFNILAQSRLDLHLRSSYARGLLSQLVFRKVQ